MLGCSKFITLLLEQGLNFEHLNLSNYRVNFHPGFLLLYLVFLREKELVYFPTVYVLHVTRESKAVAYVMSRQIC